MNTFCLVLISALLTGSLPEQEPTLRDAVRRKEGPVTVRVRELSEPQSLELLLGKSDLVVRGTIGNVVASNLSRDEQDVQTEYRVHISEFLFRAITADVQGEDAPYVTIVQRGGTTLVDGYPLTVKHLALPALKPGTEVILFLVAVDGKYKVAQDFFGAFAIHGHMVTPLGKASVFDERLRHGVSVEQFRDEIEMTLSALPAR